MKPFDWGSADLRGSVLDTLELQEEFVRGSCPVGRSTASAVTSGPGST